MSQERKKIKNALISVFYKDGLEPLVKKLHDLGVNIFSTGGTQNFIEGLGVPVISVESLTRYPYILGGRVKTLHPKIFGGILGRRDLRDDQEQLVQFEIPEIDLVIVDLYPFSETLASGAAEKDIIEKIDIGGISLIRAGAKNYKDVVIVSSREQYHGLLEIIEKNEGSTSLEERKHFAAFAFHQSSAYDASIFNWFNADKNIPAFKASYFPGTPLRYGENPHQKGYFYGRLEDVFEKLGGKELSYNNLLDVDAAVNLMADFRETSFGILKHNNACGLASRENLTEAWNLALACDPVSAFGGILITNAVVDPKTAEAIHPLFFEVIIAPGYEEAALAVLKQKPNRIILKQKKTKLPVENFRTILNGVMVQEKDVLAETRDGMKTVTKKVPTEKEFKDLEFALILAKHTKSNTIVLAKDRQLVASGTGQTSRVDALKQALEKAKTFGFETRGAVMASDAFFPFPDCVSIAAEHGISAIVQPGGSIKDKDSIEACDQLGLAMVTTGIRHFKH
jgi:phosphoribosylaminoimidazolecarboxamide formyltransferase / IMP cyclohydrolase